MSLWRQVSRGLRALFKRKAADQEIADEIAHFLDESAATFAARGLAREEAHRERTELIRLAWRDFNRPLLEPVEGHQAAERVRAVGTCIERLGEDGNVDRVIKVCVADENPHDLAKLGPGHEARVQRRVGKGRSSLEDRAERHSCEVRVDQERVTFGGESVAGRSQPLDLESGRHRQRLAREIAQRGRVGPLALLAVREKPPEAREMLSCAHGARDREPNGVNRLLSG